MSAVFAYIRNLKVDPKPDNPIPWTAQVAISADAGGLRRWGRCAVADLNVNGETQGLKGYPMAVLIGDGLGLVKHLDVDQMIHVGPTAPDDGQFWLDTTGLIWAVITHQKGEWVVSGAEREQVEVQSAQAQKAPDVPDADEPKAAASPTPPATTPTPKPKAKAKSKPRARAKPKPKPKPSSAT